MRLRAPILLCVAAAAAAACTASGTSVRARGELDLRRNTLTVCGTQEVYDLLMADTLRHAVSLRVDAVAGDGGQPVLAVFDGELHDTPSMRMNEGREVLLVGRVLAIEAGSCS